MRPGDQDVRADPGQEVALPDGVGAQVPAHAEVANRGHVLLVLRHVGGGGREDTEVRQALALGDESEGAPIGGKALLVAERQENAVREERRVGRLRTGHAVLLLALFVDHLVVVTTRRRSKLLSK